MRRTYIYCGVHLVVEVSILPGRGFQWSYETDNGLIGKHDVQIAAGLEDAFVRGKDEAEWAIDWERD